MSVKKHPKSGVYYFEFRLAGHKFRGTTKCANKKQAEAFERQARDRAEEQMKALAEAACSPNLDHVFARYWTEQGQYLAGSADCWRDLERLQDFLGPDKLITDLTDDDLTRLVAWRRGHRRKARKEQAPADAPLISPCTVNRSITLRLRAVCSTAKNKWRMRLPKEPDWKRHMLPEPVERIRELIGDEAEKLESARRDDYWAFFEFLHRSGVRLREAILRWDEVNFAGKVITKLGKGGKRITVPITTEIRDLLWPLQGDHPEFVFCYVARRTLKGKGLVKGMKYPVTYSGAKVAWRRLRKKSGVVGFRLHDYRHDCASKLLRSCRNLKVVQRALNHASISTTLKYSHLLTDEVSEALEALADARKSARTADRKAG